MIRYVILLLVLYGCGDKKTDFYNSSTVPDTYFSTSEAKGEIDVQLSTAGQSGTISKWFYGTQLSPLTKLPDDKMVQSLGLGTVRIGGNLYDRYDWETNATYLGGRNYVEIDSYETLIRKVRSYGAEPIMQVNLMGYRPVSFGGRSRYTMRDTADARSAGEFISHANGELGLGLKHVCLGNEFAQWADTHLNIWPDNDPLSADQYINRFIRYVIAIREAQENVSGNPNDIKIWGPEISISHLDWQSGNMRTDCDWGSTPGVAVCSYGDGKFDQFMPYFFHRLKQAESDTSRNPKGYKMLDYASFHYYPNFRTKLDDPASMIVDNDGYQMVNEMLESTQVLHRDDYVNRFDRGSYRDFRPNVFGRMNKWLKENYSDAKLVLSEFAVDSDDLTDKYHPIVRPLYMADMIGIAANNGIDSINRSFLNSYNPDPIPWTLLLDDQPTDLYKMYYLFTEYFKGDVVEATDTFDDKINAYASLLDAQDGRYNHVFVVNKTANLQTTKINLRAGASLVHEFKYDLEPWSVTLFRIPLENTSNRRIKVLEYGAKEMGINIDSHYKE